MFARYSRDRRRLEAKRNALLLELGESRLPESRIRIEREMLKLAPQPAHPFAKSADAITRQRERHALRRFQFRDLGNTLPRAERRRLSRALASRAYKVNHGLEVRG